MSHLAAVGASHGERNALGDPQAIRRDDRTPKRQVILSLKMQITTFGCS